MVSGGPQPDRPVGGGGPDAARLALAASYAVTAHAGQTRKGTTVPYAAHVLSVGALVIEHGGDTEQAIAGFLHDVVEDCGGLERAHEVGRVFGSGVEALVLALSDAAPDVGQTKADWLPRKREYLQELRALVAGGSPAVLVSACDKLHNLRAIAEDLADPGVGTDVFRRFNAPSEGHTGWYYRELVAAYAGCGLVPPRLQRALAEALAPLEASLAARGVPVVDGWVEG